MLGRRTSESSHLRHVRSSSNDTLRAKSPEFGDVSHNHKEKPSTSAVVTLWVHDDHFSKDEVLVSPDALGKDIVRPGDLIEIVALKTISDTKDFRQQNDDTMQFRHNETTGDDNQQDWHILRDASTPKCQDQDAASGVDPPTRYLCVPTPASADIRGRHPDLQVSITSTIAIAFGLRNRSQVLLAKATRKRCAASHVELIFRDQYLARSDMWRLVSSEMARQTVYKGQKILFLGTIKVVVNKIYLHGRKVKSAYFSDDTVPVFRSESARYVLFIQMSREMWDFDSEGSGEILFNKVINGFLPDLFKRWEDLDVKHLVSIVMFGRLEYEQYSLSTLGQSDNIFRQTGSTDPAEQSPSRDFYRVVVTDMASGQRTTILNELKKEFRVFLRDICVQKPRIKPLVEGSRGKEAELSKFRICGRPSTALRGNILEAINIASSQFASDYIDRDLVRTGTSIVIVTPGAGVFEVEPDLLKLTSENLTNNGIGIDLVCLSKMPLHSVPLFKYRGKAELPAHSMALKTGTGDGLSGVHSVVGSAPSRKSGLSPSALTTYGSMPKSLSRFGPMPQPERSEDWSYGIPQWIDLSYWISDDDVDLDKVGSSQPQGHKSHLDPRQATIFEPRVRMYELQMMGVMEIGLANISVPYLLEGQRTLRRMASHSSSRFTNGSRTMSSSKRSPESRHCRAEKDSHVPDGAYSSRRKNGLLSAQAKQQANFHDHMDKYDEALFYIQAKKKEDFRRRANDASPHQTVEGLVKLQQGVDKPGRAALIDTDSSAVAPASSRSSMNRLGISDNIKLKQSSVRPAPRISRSISFALRGFAPPPRATASTEINVENVQAEPVFKGTPPPRPTSTSSSTTTHPVVVKPDVKLQYLNESESPSQLDSSQLQSHLNASRPISIKAVGSTLREHGLPLRTGENTSLSNTVTRVASKQDGYANKMAAFNNLGNEGGEHAAQSVEPDMEYLTAESSLPEDISPSIKNVNPCNPAKNQSKAASWIGRWQHLYPHTPKASKVKWRSLCTPASVLLTTEDFPARQEFQAEYEQKLYIISQDPSNELTEIPKTRELLLREMIALRLVHGYQLVVGRGLVEVVGHHVLSSKFLESKMMIEDGNVIFMSMGNTVQRLALANQIEIHITEYVRKAREAERLRTQTIKYSPSIRTIFSKSYTIRPMELAGFSEGYPWSLADAYLARQKNHSFDAVKHLRFWRARFVLLPVEPPASAWRPAQSGSDENEEEIQLLGIRALTHMWQRYRYIPPEERGRFKPTGLGRQDSNPLEINFQTLNPSEVVMTEIDKLLAAEEAGEVRTPSLLPESELLERATTSVPKLAQIMQSEKGVDIVTRRWHLRLHYNCFKGDEFTNWLLQNFKDVETRDEAVDFGNELMKHGLFQHVEKRHNFKDGNYFYQIDSEYRTPRSDLRDSWFRTGRRGDRSIPSTPIAEHLSSPLGSRSRSGSNLMVAPTEQGTSIKRDNATEKRQLSISLSKMMYLDVDYRKRSGRPEVINLHYDRLHNPENCYHLELSWINVTSKLVEDAIVTWATQAERYGLKLVEVPIAEASSISEREPFRAPCRISLKAEPPTNTGIQHANGTTYFTSTSFTPQVAAKPDHLFYHKALLKKCNFVLDLEAASEFPPNVDITYSWGKLEYRYSQYVHRSGVILAQITDEGDFLLLANRLYNTRSASTKDTTTKFDAKKARPGSRAPPAPSTHPSAISSGLDAPHPSPHPSPLVRASSDAFGSKAALNSSSIATYITPEQIKDDLEAFCHDVPKLEAFYKEVAYTEKPTRKSTSSSSSALRPVQEQGLEMSIPDLRLPASIVPGVAGKAADVMARKNARDLVGMLLQAIEAYKFPPFTKFSSWESSRSHWWGHSVDTERTLPSIEPPRLPIFFQKCTLQGKHHSWQEMKINLE